MNPIKSKFSVSEEVDDERDIEEEKDQISKLPPKDENKFILPVSKKANSLNKFAPLDYKLYFSETVFIEDGTIPVYISGNKGPILFCLHGAGHSGLTFSIIANLLKNSMRVISFDFRNHGSNSRIENSKDLSQEALIDETITVLSWVINTYPEENIVILGHSMGGSIATKTVSNIFATEDLNKAFGGKIQGLIVIDVVEGTAMEALPFMENIVKSRPKSFSSVETAIQYFVRSGSIRNYESARVSVPSLVTETSKGVFEWRTNLLETKKFWSGWFEGLTQCFLSIRIPKMLLLAASDRMDKDLTIAQMQGKFKLSVIHDVGHIIHEDDPKKTAEVIEGFVKIFRIPALFKDLKPIVAKIQGSGSSNFIKKSEETKDS